MKILAIIGSDAISGSTLERSISMARFNSGEKVISFIPDHVIGEVFKKYLEEDQGEDYDVRVDFEVFGDHVFKRSQMTIIVDTTHGPVIPMINI